MTRIVSDKAIKTLPLTINNKNKKIVNYESMLKLQAHNRKIFYARIEKHFTI